MLTGIINKPLLLHLIGCLYYLYFITFFLRLAKQSQFIPLQNVVYFTSLPFWFVKYSHFTQTMCYYLNVHFQCQRVNKLSTTDSKIPQTFIILQMIEKCLAFMERNNLLAFSQNPTTGPYPASKKLCPQPHAVFLIHTYDYLAHVSTSQTLTSLEVFDVKSPIFDLQRTVHRDTSWFKYDRYYLCVNKPVTVPVIFEPPCIFS